jgi:Tub family
MNKADEKRAFEQMMVEISDSDSDGEQESAVGNRPSVASAKRPVKSDSVDTNQFASRAAPDRGVKMSSHDEEIENFGWRSSDRLEPTFISPQMEQITTMKRWLLRPCAPKDPPVLCYVERHRVGFGRINPTYKCFLEGSDDQGPRFLMAAKKKSGSQTSYYLISLDLDDQSDRGSESVLGKVRGNSVGSQYLITDSGLAPDKAVAPSMLRKVN